MHVTVAGGAGREQRAVQARRESRNRPSPPSSTPQRTVNMLHAATRALAERANPAQDHLQGAPPGQSLPLPHRRHHRRAVVLLHHEQGWTT
jgi:hypothetical protein